MSDDGRRHRARAKTEEIYRAYGEFAVKFEHVCEAIRVNLMRMLEKAGLKNHRVAQVLLAELTAEPLRAMFSALVAETQKGLDNQEKLILSNVLKRFQDLIDKRNDIIHGLWFVGWEGGESDIEDTVLGVKLHRSKKGASTKVFQYSVTEFRTLTREAEILKTIFYHLSSCLSGRASMKQDFKVGSSIGTLQTFKVGPKGRIDPI